jgi:hypothetical protein
MTADLWKKPILCLYDSHGYFLTTEREKKINRVTDGRLFRLDDDSFSVCLCTSHLFHLHLFTKIFRKFKMTHYVLAISICVGRNLLIRIFLRVEIQSLHLTGLHPIGTIRRWRSGSMPLTTDQTLRGSIPSSGTLSLCTITEE